MNDDVTDMFLDDLEALRTEINADISVLEHMGEEVAAIRKRCRMLLQRVDQLELRASQKISALQAQLLSETDRANRLQLDVDRLQRELMERPSPLRGA